MPRTNDRHQKETRVAKRSATGLAAALVLVLSASLPVRAAKIKSVQTAAAAKRTCLAARVSPRPPVIDGRLDDPAWNKAEWQSDFTQYDPYEAAPPTEKTSFKVLYDDKDIYVGIKADDGRAASIERRLSRRDNLGGDWVAVMIDSHHDKLTCCSFRVSSAGVRAEEFMSHDSSSFMNADPSWDPIWEVRTSVGKDGWTAEMKIPLSQLRFSAADEEVWGLQVSRYLFRNGEKSLWQFIPKSSSGWISQFGELRGIRGIKPARQIEITPYVVGSLNSSEAEAGNPFADGTDSKLVGGVDGKIGLTHEVTVNFTINPDFGQVEADPSEMNLTAFETWYEEKRPFFVEGSNIFDFSVSDSGGDFGYDNLFYSRRIGRAPQGEVDSDGYVDIPAVTKILGAFKLSGKTKSGLTIGIMDSLTSAENASIYENGEYGTQAVEPLTNYLVCRLQQDLRQGATTIGAMFTAVDRRLDEEALDFLHKEAYTGGLDLMHAWDDKNYYVSLKSVFSLVKGSAEAIDETQTSSAHYFQRSDADYLHYDPTRTSLSGYGGTLDLGKQGGGNLSYSAGVTWRSPGLELNDIGYLRSADRIMQYVWAGYRIFKPSAAFRSMSINANQWTSWDFGGERLSEGGNINTWSQLQNHWMISWGLSRNFNGLSTTALWGGPALRMPGSTSVWGMLSTDERKDFRVTANVSENRRVNRDSNYYSLGLKFAFVPSPACNFSISPAYSWNYNEMQYVGEYESGGETRYLTGRINQKTVSATLRLDLCLAPDLTIQLYGMPYISAGKYSRFKNVDDPRASVFADRYQLLGEGAISYDASANYYSVDENGDGQADYGFDNPDFNFLQFRSNLVMRWEFKPGCTAYLAWSQDRTNYLYDGDFDFESNWASLFSTHPNNVLLIKIAYTFNM